MKWLALALSSVVVAGCIAKKQTDAVPASQGVATEARPKINVMAPLIIGDPANLDSMPSLKAWASFRTELNEIKKLGAYGVTTDLWWGIVEPEDNKFSWAYYDRLAEAITAADLKWIPILSTHQCGGNVGDNCDVPIPSWLWTKYSSKTVPEHNLQYVSEQGNVSREVISVWSTQQVLQDYRELYIAFQNRFQKYAEQIAEINISLGPSGELRYPAYNSHDKDTGYPNRGAFQSYSPLAVSSWKAYAAKQGSKLKLQGLPPLSAQRWVDAGHYRKAGGRLYIEWYQKSLLEHGDLLMTQAINIFNEENAAFRGIDIGAKIPGIHWRIGTVEQNGTVAFGDRLAEVSSGLINLDAANWKQDLLGRGYHEIIALFSSLGAESEGARVVLHFTALEMQDGQDRPEVQSMAASLVRWVGAEALRQKVPIKGENALAGNLGDPQAWVRMASHLKTPQNIQGQYQGLTILRMSDVLANAQSAAAFKKLAIGQ